MDVQQEYRCKDCGEEHSFDELMRCQCKKCGSNQFTVKQSRHPGAVCDFCSHPEVRFSYPCRDFVQQLMAGPLHERSAGEWASCEPCRNMIERGDREGLAQRSFDRLRRHNPDTPRVLGTKNCLRMIRQTHDNFWANREGPALELLEATDGK